MLFHDRLDLAFAIAARERINGRRHAGLAGDIITQSPDNQFTVHRIQLQLVERAARAQPVAHGVAQHSRTAARCGCRIVELVRKTRSQSAERDEFLVLSEHGLGGAQPTHYRAQDGQRSVRVAAKQILEYFVVDF